MVILLESRYKDLRKKMQKIEEENKIYSDLALMVADENNR